ncbi:Nucleoside-diphosphate-sugar epimerase [Yoonia tamlensis]|uniref:Nucleoside-diphosphate-sugar epimerase n=1 Tax=Yoonia tamlensis TaxID=390270 RepID=A0A1I6GVE6_9RHOB|nr:NAD-dependent epimerase/dehydratase family protein [Yoonia tamlensis]SFR46150.1 Nucleoside-diphosphate-sugar epimerase [Yoonia tamlensis]
MTQTVLILGGSGKIGSHAAIAFTDAGWTVRHYDRKAGDMTRAALGADVIVNGLNPPNYHNWAQLIPQITSQVITAAKASGATVIVPANIYNFGNHPGTFDEHTPQRPHTRKGKIRVDMEKSYAAAGVQTILLRAGNFIDPNGNGDIMSAAMMRSIRKGKLTFLGDPTAMQAYCYVPDWARAAVQLAQIRDQLGRFEDVPFSGHAFTMIQLQQDLARHLGRDVKLSAFPWWAMKLLSPVWELARELTEMRYAYAMPHQISDVKFRRLLPDFAPTDLATVMRAGLPRDINPDKPVRPRAKAAIVQ